MFQLDILGPFRMTEDGGNPLVFPARSASAVLAFLALQKGRPVSRRELAQTLWPDQYTDAAKTNLRTALHRIRKTLPGDFPLLLEGDTVALDLSLVETDLDRADRLRRTFLFTPDQPEGLEALAEEWGLRKRELLEGWDFEWIEPHRTRAWMAANDIAGELGRALEHSGDMEWALRIWHEVLDRVPHHAEALKHALRLEFQVHGKERAAELAKQTSLYFRTESGIEMPRELQKTLKEVRAGLLEPIAQPEFIRKRSELFLLARLFESNLRENRHEALALLARESKGITAVTHPRAMLSLLTLALERTEGVSPERVKVAAEVSLLASWASEFEIGHQWADFVLAHGDPNEPTYGNVQSMKGFMYFEQRRYDEAKVCLQESIKHLEKQGRTDEFLRAMARLAGVQWHQLEFDTAIETYLRLIEAVGDRNDESALASSAMAHGNLCFVYAVTSRWAEAVHHGRECLRQSHTQPLYGIVCPTPLGLALFAEGDKIQGLRDLTKGVSSSCREGMWRFNQIAIDFAAVALDLAGRHEAARCILQANSDHRAALLHERSPAERGLIDSLMGTELVQVQNPLKGQSAATLSEWVCDELDRLAQSLA